VAGRPSLARGARSGGLVSPALALYDALAATYEDHFRVPHRRAYDDLAWEICSAAVPPPPAVVVDVGCGVGRWSRRLLTDGYRVIGVEPAPAMAEIVARELGGPGFTLHPDRVEELELPAGSADAVLAIGSLQYSADPADAVRRCAHWLAPGGVLCVMVDSLEALVLELLAADREDEALERLSSRLGVWRMEGHEAELHLFDSAALQGAAVAAGLHVERVAGLLVGASAHGRARLLARLQRDYAAQLAAERRLAARPELADLGKQLLMIARAPAP
jgi:SAM-dependent methyltransferase